MHFYEIKLSNTSGTIDIPYNSHPDVSDEEKMHIACQMIAEFACELAQSGEYDEFLEETKEIFNFIRKHEVGEIELNSTVVTIRSKEND